MDVVHMYTISVFKVMFIPKLTVIGVFEPP